jgi:hypothetical protein
MSENSNNQELSVKRIVIKGILLFLIIDLLFIPLSSENWLGKISAYNVIFPGRLRLPYGENPDQAYNLSLYNLDAMFASHILDSSHKPGDEFRVLLIGDSSVWGYLLKPENTLSAYINAANIKLSDGRKVRAYNLGYPTLSLTKDLLILNYAEHYQPDLIIWLLTLESFPMKKQLDSPILQNNPNAVRQLIKEYSLYLDSADPRFITPGFLDLSLIGSRRSLADLIRLQLYGVMWAATGIDQYYPATYEPPQENLARDDTFQGLQPPNLSQKDLSFDVLVAGSKITSQVPVIFVNEPIYLSHGDNSDIRYNFFYPRWAYDQYRILFENFCQANNWQCLDEWQLVQPSEFTNSAIHMTPNATRLLANILEDAIITRTNP